MCPVNSQSTRSTIDPFMRRFVLVDINDVNPCILFITYNSFHPLFLLVSHIYPLPYFCTLLHIEYIQSLFLTSQVIQVDLTLQHLLYVHHVLTQHFISLRQVDLKSIHSLLLDLLLFFVQLLSPNVIVYVVHHELVCLIRLIRKRRVTCTV